MKYIYFLAKNRIPHSTTYQELIELQVLNGDKLLDKNLGEGPSNAQYTSRFSVRVLIEGIDIWIKRKLMCSLQESPYFSILADKCQDISTQEELSICGRWLVNGKREEHFLTVLHVCSTATFAGKISVVREFKPPRLMQFTSIVLVTGYSSFQFRQLHQ